MVTFRVLLNKKGGPAILKREVPVVPINKASAAGELALIERIRQRAAALPQTPELALGIGDDCAILRPRAGEETGGTTDLCLEGRHWRRDWNTPESAGHRTLARGLSDLAAMGARSVTAFLSLALPAETARDTAWVDRFLDGLLLLAARHGVPLAGGDTSESPSAHVLADIVCIGTVPHGTALRRTGAQPGDALYITGSPGNAAASMQRVAAAAAAGSPPLRGLEAAGHPFLLPEPCLRAGQILREQGFATACMDLSDGLSTDLRHLCLASGVAAEIELAALPRRGFVRELPEAEARAAMLHGGEDYELLCTAPADRPVPQLPGTELTRIGTVLPARPGQPIVSLRLPDGSTEPLEPGGWEHLQ